MRNLNPNQESPVGTNNLALLATLKAKPGKVEEVKEFLVDALPLAEAEQETNTWFALRMDHRTFGIFDTFADDAGREAHLNGQIAAALMSKADELLAEAPDIRKVEILAAKT